jgi:L-lactate dehydrogenase (cytochrome)
MASLKPQSPDEDKKPTLAAIINTYDFEEVARKTVPKKVWAFYSSAATDLITRDSNKSSYDRIFFRPRVLRNVTNVNTETKMLGQKMALPLFVAPAAMANMIHPDGEKALARGTASQGIIQCVGYPNFLYFSWTNHNNRFQTTQAFP